jgi:hypothetical protein
MWLQFFSQNFHFAINLFAALVCAAICWLYLDAWMGGHTKKALLRWAGFGALSLSFLAQATVIEQSVLGDSLLGNVAVGLIVGLRIAGYAAIIAAEIIDPLQVVPKNTGLQLEPKKPKPTAAPKAPVQETPKPTPAKVETVPAQQAPAVAAPSTQSAPVPTVATASRPSQPTLVPASEPATAPVAEQPVQQTPPKQASALLPFVGVATKWLLPLMGFVVAALYWRRATTGLERHLKRVAIGFAFIALSDLAGMTALLRDTQNPTLYSWVAAFGWVWMLAQVLLLAGALILGRWVWSYLTKRFFSQLFMVFMAITVIVFFVVTVAFTSLLLRSIRSDAVKNLQTAGSVLNYALQSKQAETMAGARQLAANTDIIKAVQTKDHARLDELVQNYLADNKQTSLVITNQSGQVILRGHDTEQWGDSLSDDLLVKRALLGDSRSSVISYNAVGAPMVQVRSAAIIRAADGTIAGSVMTGLDLGSAFVDSIQQSTGWQSSIYAGNVLAATTLSAPDGKTRSAGLVLSEQKVIDEVLKGGNPYAGTLRLQNREELGAFLPLKDVDNVTLGMLMVSEPQSSILRTAGRSIELTFLLTGILILLSVAPIYWVTKVIEKQID